MLSNCMSCDIFFRELEARIKDQQPGQKSSSRTSLPAPNTPLIANPVRVSHKANTTALKVARTCPSSSLRSGEELTTLTGSIGM